MNIDLFISEINKLGVNITDDKLKKLEKFYDLLVSWNEKMNLTSITDHDQVYLKHFYDSLTISKVTNLSEINSLCDIGTGAGFPGIVLKIFYPDLKLTLVDSLQKRITFLNEVVNVLNLKDVYPIHIRAEDFSRQVRETFDVVTARAVSSLNVLLEYSLPLVRTGKYFVAMRGSDDTQVAYNALNILNAEIVKVEHFKLPVENSERTIALIRKNEITDKKYPRKFSEIKKNPL